MNMNTKAFNELKMRLSKYEGINTDNANNYLDLQNLFLEKYPIKSDKFDDFRFELTDYLKYDYGNEYVLCIEKKSITEEFKYIDYNRLIFKRRNVVEYNPWYWQLSVVTVPFYTVRPDPNELKFKHYRVFEKSKHGPLNGKYTMVQGHMAYNPKYKLFTVEKMDYIGYGSELRKNFTDNLLSWNYISDNALTEMEKESLETNIRLRDEFHNYIIGEGLREFEEEIGGYKLASNPDLQPSVEDYIFKPHKDITNLGFFHIGVMVSIVIDTPEESLFSKEPEKHDVVVMESKDMKNIEDELKDDWLGCYLPKQKEE